MPSNFSGKVFKEMVSSESESIIYFTDGSEIKIELVSVNNSCHCHPEYEHSLEVTTINMEEC